MRTCLETLDRAASLACSLREMRSPGRRCLSGSRSKRWGFWPMVAAPRATDARRGSVTSVSAVRAWRGRRARRTAADLERRSRAGEGEGDDEGSLAQLGLTMAGDAIAGVSGR
jgi:hypothetical protein